MIFLKKSYLLVNIKTAGEETLGCQVKDWAFLSENKAHKGAEMMGTGKEEQLVMEQPERSRNQTEILWADTHASTFSGMEFAELR